MKRIQLYGYCMLFVSITACNEETPIQIIQPENHPASKFEEIAIREVFQNGIVSENVTAEKKFSYTDGRLTQSTHAQFFYGGSLMHSSWITYSNYQATVTDEFGNISVYTLNDRGYAVSCARQNEVSGEKREYTFHYTEDNTEHTCLLSQIEENINNKVYSQIQIEYAEAGGYQINVLVEDNLQTYSATLPEEQRLHNLCDLPDPFLSQTYPLSLHEEALYGKLLGDAYPVLITQINPGTNTNTDTNTETIKYLYELDKNGLVTACKQETIVIEIQDGEHRETTYSHNLLYSFR